MPSWAIVFITIVYFLMLTLTREIPAASSLYGHGMGILGFVLMLMTETLYTLRKRWKNARWGKMARWLEFHIFTGIVGPYLVLLHTSWKFNGLAGVVMLLTGGDCAERFYRPLHLHRRAAHRRRHRAQPGRD